MINVNDNIILNPENVVLAEKKNSVYKLTLNNGKILYVNEELFNEVIEYEPGGGSGGTTVIANPSGDATVDLHKLQVDSTIYGLPEVPHLYEYIFVNGDEIISFSEFSSINVENLSDTYFESDDYTSGEPIDDPDDNIFVGKIFDLLMSLCANYRQNKIQGGALSNSFGTAIVYDFQIDRINSNKVRVSFFDAVESSVEVIITKNNDNTYTIDNDESYFYLYKSQIF